MPRMREGMHRAGGNVGNYGIRKWFAKSGARGGSVEW